METTRRDIEDFFEIQNDLDWGSLLAVKCTPNDLSDYAEKNIPDAVRSVLQDPEWKTQTSVDWAYQSSSNPEFYVFKVWELWNSIRRYGIKSPVHAHRLPLGGFLFHPSNNKIEVLCEYFPDIAVTVLYHDYCFLEHNYPHPDHAWYKKHQYEVISSSKQYQSLFSLDADSELEFGWEYVSKICADPKSVWSKLSPVSMDWQDVDHEKYQSDVLYSISVHLTCNDKYHRVKMEKNNKMLKDLIQVKPGQFKFCGKWYDIDG